MREEIEARIEDLKFKLEDEYQSSQVKDELQADLDFLLKLRHALYFYP